MSYPFLNKHKTGTIKFKKDVLKNKEKQPETVITDLQR